MGRKNKKNLKANQGFTLVELLVVIAIIGVLATLLLLQLGTARAKARDAKRVSDINQIRTALDQYFDDNATYPNFSLYDTTASPLSPYLQQVPVDPLDNAQYGYMVSSAPPILGFQVFAELEAGSPALRTDADINSSGWTNKTATTQPGGRMSGAAGTDPNNPNCPDRNLATLNCVFDLGVTP